VPIRNFKFFALDYLNDWCGHDHDFVFGLSADKTASERVETLQRAAKYYGVARTLKICGENERLGFALAELDAIPSPVTDDTVDSVVHRLAEALRSKYDNYAISAASKFLWLRFKAPVVIYDAKAVACLRCGGGTFDHGDYSGYRREWRNQFAKREAVIRSACSELIQVRKFSLAHMISDAPFTELTSSTWFRERVFDKYLWRNADS
jgi:hypothetical protein